MARAARAGRERALVAVGLVPAPLGGQVGRDAEARPRRHRDRALARHQPADLMPSSANRRRAACSAPRCSTGADGGWRRFRSPSDALEAARVVDAAHLDDRERAADVQKDRACPRADRYVGHDGVHGVTNQRAPLSASLAAPFRNQPPDSAAGPSPPRDRRAPRPTQAARRRQIQRRRRHVHQAIPSPRIQLARPCRHRLPRTTARRETRPPPTAPLPALPLEANA